MWSSVPILIGQRTVQDHELKSMLDAANASGPINNNFLNN